jgi:hypothetical protein
MDGMMVITIAYTLSEGQRDKQIYQADFKFNPKGSASLFDINLSVLY